MKTHQRRYFQAFSIFLLFLTALNLSGCTPQNPNQDTTTIPNPAQPISEPSALLFDFYHQSDGLTIGKGGDVDWEIVEVDGSPDKAFRTGNGLVLAADDPNPDPDCCIRFDVDDNFYFGGSPAGKIQIEIEYLDTGTDRFNVEYDSLSDGGDDTGRFVESDVITKTDTGEFLTGVIVLDDAHFANRQYGGDFRIFDFSDGAETIRQVKVTLLNGDQELAQEDVQPLLENQANIIFHNGLILTQEGGTIAEAIAIKNEYIMAVGSDEEVILFAGSGTKVVDLEGRTLMPGFIDSHNHFFNSWGEGWDAAQDFLLSLGMTTTAEMSAQPDVMRGISEFDQEFGLHMRVSLYPAHVDNCGVLLGDWYLDEFPPSCEPGAMLQVPGIKVFNDGGSCNVPAYSYETTAGTYGDLYFSIEELTAIVVEIQNNGYQAAIHSLGDRAIDTTQQAIIAALAGQPNILHHRIEHNTMLRDDLLTAYAEYDIVAIIFGSFPSAFFSSSGYSTPPEYREWEWRWRDVLDANLDAHIAWHSDHPPMGFPIDPIEQLFGFVTRKDILNDGSVVDPPDWAADDVLSVEEALEIMTIGSAYAILRENELGSLLPGKLADLIILSENPLAVDPDSIPEIEVLMTMVGGNVEFCLPGQEKYCP